MITPRGLRTFCPVCGGSGERIRPRMAAFRSEDNQVKTLFVEELCKACGSRGWFGDQADQAECQGQEPDEP